MWWKNVPSRYDIEVSPELVAAEVADQARAYRRAMRLPCPTCGRPVGRHNRRQLEACDNARPYELVG